MFTPIPNNVIDDIRSDYNGGDTIKAICNRYGVSKATVSRATTDLRTKVGKVWMRNSQLPPSEEEADYSALMENFKKNNVVRAIFDVEKNKIIMQKIENIMVDLNVDSDDEND